MSEENNHVFGGVEFEQNAGNEGFVDVNFNEGEVKEEAGTMFKPVEDKKSMVKQGFWSKVKSFLFQEIDLTAPIKIELTPYQQKVEDEINEFLHQEISFKGFWDILKK